MSYALEGSPDVAASLRPCRATRVGSMTSVAFTGATGFIGRALDEALRRENCQAIPLARRANGSALTWTMGQELPAECAEADAIIHLASAALVETESKEAAAKRDIDGTRVLLEQVRRARRAGARTRFIFLSSQSARPGAANVYGQSKWAIEQMLDQDDEIAVRPGLVYGDPPASVFAMFDKLARLPIVPVVSDRRGIQPIHVRELAECLVQLVKMASPPKLVQLGAVKPLSFVEALEATARRAGRRQPIMLRVPAGPVRMVTRLLDRTLDLTLTERLDGLAGLDAIETEASLGLLGRTLQPFDDPVRSGPVAHGHSHP